MTVVSAGDRQAEGQHQGGQAHGGRWTLPRRSAARLTQACIRCAGDGIPRELPRGIVGRSFFVEERVIDVFSARKHTDTGPVTVSGDGEDRVGVRETLCVADRSGGGGKVLSFNPVQREVGNGAGAVGVGHFALLCFGLLRAAHDQRIEHDAPLNKENVFIVRWHSDYGAKPSNG